jgi:hypothetical protein
MILSNLPVISFVIGHSLIIFVFWLLYFISLGLFQVVTIALLPYFTFQLDSYSLMVLIGCVP